MISQDVVAHWLDLINMEGWIPREQILGDESRSKVPKVRDGWHKRRQSDLVGFVLQEFIVQHNENANPPTFFLTLETLIQRMETEEDVVRAMEETRTGTVIVCSYLYRI